MLSFGRKSQVEWVAVLDDGASHACWSGGPDENSMFSSRWGMALSEAVKPGTAADIFWLTKISAGHVGGAA
jgi:hypothetical protein